MSYGSDFDFNPSEPSSSIFPLFVWKEKRLNHFQTKGLAWEGTSIDLSQSPLEMALLTVYQKLSFCELVEVSNVCGAQVSPEKLFTLFGYRWDQRLEKAIQHIKVLPKEFQQWAKQRKVTPKDIQVFNTVTADLWPSVFFEKLIQLNPTRSEGIQILEIFCDLIYANEQPIENVVPVKITNSAQWIQILRALKNPNTFTRDKKKQEELLGLNIPKKLQPRWVRKGDKSGLELQLMISNKEDLKISIDNLKKVLESWTH